MPAVKQTETPEGTKENPTEPPKKEVMGIERDNANTRISFTEDGNLMIITVPIGYMPRALVHGFVYELHEIVNEWFRERKAVKDKLRIDQRDTINKFSFKSGINKLLGR